MGLNRKSDWRAGRAPSEGVGSGRAILQIQNSDMSRGTSNVTFRVLLFFDWL